MTRRHNFVASVASSVAMSILILLYFQPQTRFSPLVDLGIIIAIEVIALVLATASTNKPKGRIFVKILVYSLLVAGLITYVLNPKINAGFAMDLIFVLIVQVLGYVVALFVV